MRKNWYSETISMVKTDTAIIPKIFEDDICKFLLQSQSYKRSIRYTIQKQFSTKKVVLFFQNLGNLIWLFEI